MGRSPDRGEGPTGGVDGRADRSSVRGVARGVLGRLRDWGDRLSPEVIRGDAEALLLFDVARRLGQAGREDQSAVGELRRIAGGRRATLEGAEQLTRVAGQHLDHADINRAHRLLRAALHDVPLVTVDGKQKARFELLDEVLNESRPEDELWHDLIQREPRLGPLRDRARTGTYGPRWPTRPGPGASDPPRDPSAKRASARGSSALVDAIESLVGPEATTTDTVIAAQRTRVWVHRYLTQQRPEQTLPAPE